MRLLVCLLISVSCVSLGAQDAGRALGPAAQLLDTRLRQLKGGLLVVADDAKGSWKSAADALATDPAWLDLELQVSYYGAKAAEVEALLQQKYQVGPRPHWVLLGEGGRVAATGTTPPTAATLAKAAQDGGIRSATQLLRDFVRRNPDHLEARMALCSALNAKAAARTSARLGKKTDPLRAADEKWDFARSQKEWDAKEDAKAQAAQEEKPPERLDPEEDRAIWGELADLLASTFRSGEWRGSQVWGLVPDEAAVHSPLMQEACRASVLEVERALAREPSSWDLWRVWLGLTRTFGGRPIRPLLDGLAPLPTWSATSWPPYPVREAYVRDARKRKDWTGIRDLLLPQVENTRAWEAAQGRTTILSSTDGKVQASPETGAYWRSTLEPLVEALIWLGDIGKADDLVREGFARNPWELLPSRARALALRCGQPHLAAQWGALGPGK